MNHWPDPDRREGALTRCLTDVHLTPWPWEIELTDKERTTLQAFASGLTDSETATVLGVSLDAVRSRRAQIRAKLRAKTTAQACAIAVRNGLIS